jgi:hypothetical protein
MMQKVELLTPKEVVLRRREENFVRMIELLQQQKKLIDEMQELADAKKRLDATLNFLEREKKEEEK